MGCVFSVLIEVGGIVELADRQRVAAVEELNVFVLLVFGRQLFVGKLGGHRQVFVIGEVKPAGGNFDRFCEGAEAMK